MRHLVSGGAFRSATAFALLLVMLLSPASRSAAEEIPVCLMSRDEFVGLAFPDTVANRLHGGRLLKHDHPPALIVFLPSKAPQLTTEIEAAIAKMAADNLAPPSRSSIITYNDFSEVLAAVHKLGRSDVFIFIADPSIDQPHDRYFRSALEFIVRWPQDADALVEQAGRPRGYTAQTAADGITHEVQGTAVVVNSGNKAVGQSIYVAYYSAVSPTASSANASLNLFFTKKLDGSVELTDLARRYFRIFTDERVKNGATKDSFVACDQ